MNGQASVGIAGLYQEMIIEHARSPRNFRELAAATCTVDVVNPLCGDHLTLYLDLTDGAVSDIAFEGNGCAISRASASLMTMAVKGLPQGDALALFTRVHSMLTTETVDEQALVDVGKLAALSGVWEYPGRVKCATLAWQALRNALETGDHPSEKE
ncbi:MULTISPECIES: Fe-S cluster assembly sulfur transfer protein SufU [unclassified Cryobacterium]|uniref:Fe-S cluster assembly sulfur transfer protein SufU n=1 Tax=unclassified Cryobacterium TaxID=2649013 RepID=UPI000CE32B2D|nr:MULTISPECIES: SUF system NifU family Fe-S cluster assembly protein [unclassified Cryobacterium]